MVNLLLVSHGDLAEGLLSAMHLIVGELEGVVAMGLKETDSIDDFQIRMETAVEELSLNANVLILLDLFGASPFNICVKLFDKRPDIQFVSGMNLPMVLEVAMQREGHSAEALAKIAAEAGRSGIKSLNELLNQAALP
jgi:PTS system mannose-specific IIA component